MREPRRVCSDTYAVLTDFPAAHLGTLPINWFLIKAREPVLVDTGMPREREQFLATLGRLLDPGDLRWIFLTHDDNDHAGNLGQVMQLAPKARLVIPFLGFARLADTHEFPLERVLLVNPGQRFSAGDRELVVMAPANWDSPATHCLYDPSSSALFSADALGALLPTPAAELEEVPETAFWEGFRVLASGISPWLHLVDEGKLARRLAAYGELRPEVVLSSHGPVVRGRFEALLRALAAVPATEAFLGPDHREMLAILAQSRGLAEAA
jgi:flavorubredoxin